MFFLADCAPWWLLRTWSSCNGNSQPRLGCRVTVSHSALPPSSIYFSFCVLSHFLSLLYLSTFPPNLFFSLLPPLTLSWLNFSVCCLAMPPCTNCFCPCLPAEAYELLKENLYTRDDAVIGEAAGLAMGLVMLGTKSPAALEHMVNVSCAFCCLSSARSFHLLLIVLEGHAAREDSERPGSRHSNG